MTPKMRTVSPLLTEKGGNRAGGPSEGAPASFGDLLRQHRLKAGLTQQLLAEGAGLSVHGVQKLERGATRPYPDTVQRLLRVLQLGPTELATFQIAAQPHPHRRPSRPAAPPASA